MASNEMAEFWNARADEDAYFFVDNRLTFGSSEVERFWSGGSEALDAILQIAGAVLGPADHVVEIGCGVGRLTRVIAERAASVVALDVSARMIELAREYNPGLENVDWRVGSGMGLDGIVDESADACISHVVFQHIPDVAITLGYVREIGRVLKPGGWAAYQVSNLPRVHQKRPPVRRAVERVSAALGRSPKGSSHPAWRGSAVDLQALRAAADDGGAPVSSVAGAGTQFCIVSQRKPGRGAGGQDV